MIKKINEILNDKKTYKQIKIDPTKKYQKINNELISDWENKSFIPPNKAKTLQIRNAIPPKIYGLPKLHKNNIPLRPIISCIQSPFEKLSKFLKQIIQNIANKNDYYIKDSFQFKEKIKNVIIPNNYSLISLDVISLYTNIPIKLAIKIINEKWNKIKNFTDIPQEEFIKAIEITLTSTYFMYENKIYQQIDGCAMGSAISSIIAQIVIESLEESVIQNLTKRTNSIPFFFRYVDDCILAVPKNKINFILNKFNSFHKKIQFTLEIENENKINFLDMTLYHSNKCIKTQWYTKKTWSARYLHFQSSHPITQKKTVIIGLADRAIKLSNPEYRETAIQKAKNALKANNYPTQLINKIFKNRIIKFYNNSTKNTQKTQTHFISIPFIEGLSQQLQKLFQHHNITICHTSYNTINKDIFSKLKTKTPKNKKSNVIYQIPCNNCENVYIGQTSQYLENRLNSHKYDKKNQTALTNHEKLKKHTFNYNNTKILQIETNTKKREILEMIEIQKNKKTVNDKKDIKNLNKIYNTLF